MFKQFIAQLTAKLQRFMAGRYGTDRLNMTILGVGLAACLISAFFRNPLVNLILTALSYGLMIWAITRTLSRNVYKRYQENRKFLQFFDRLRDRQHRYYDCPKCREKFIRKT